MNGSATNFSGCSLKPPFLSLSNMERRKRLQRGSPRKTEYLDFGVVSEQTNRLHFSIAQHVTSLSGFPSNPQIYGFHFSSWTLSSKVTIWTTPGRLVVLALVCLFGRCEVVYGGSEGSELWRPTFDSQWEERASLLRFYTLSS